MGMRKISEADGKFIVQLIHKWPKTTRLTWEGLRREIMKVGDDTLNTTWTRQALSDNESIKTAYLAAKERLKSKEHSTSLNKDTQQIDIIRNLEFELSELRQRFDKLTLRHTQLIYNASLLEGGSRLLDDPLPDNTRSQGG